jgi:hypothetical protein
MILVSLEHVNFCASVSFRAPLLLSQFLIVSLFAQALILSRNKAAKRAMEVVQHDRVTELERVNAELTAELEQSPIKIVMMEQHGDSLRLGYEKLESECEKFRDVAETLKQEAMETEKTCENQVATMHVKLLDYRVQHCKKLHEKRFNQEDAMNNYGVQCLPYQGKGSTIGNMVQWFDEEIKALPATFVKANKIFACYAIVGVLWMLQDSGCKHLLELQSLTSLPDALLLDDLPSDLAKLTDRLVQKWWAEHGLPEDSHHLWREPEVVISTFDANFSFFMF